MKFAMLAAFGVIGVLARYAIGQALSRQSDGAWPIGTMMINLAGCFCIGLIYALGAERDVIPESLRLPLITGFLGGFTTFSAFSLESLQLLEKGAHVPGLLYLVGSPLLGLASTALGLWIARAL